MNQNYLSIKNYFVIAAAMLLFIAKQTTAQAPQIQWAYCFGGSADDRAKDLHRTSDSGYVVCGYTSSIDDQVTGNHGGIDAWIIKLDVAGTLLWQKTYGGSNDDAFNAIRQLKDGGYLACGYTASSDGDVDSVRGGKDFWMVRIDGNGTILWQRTFGGSNDDVANDVATTADTGFVVAGYTFSPDGDITNYKNNGDGWLVYVDTLGNLIRQKDKGGQDYDEFKSIITANNGGFLLVGLSFSNTGTLSGLNHGGSDAWLARLSKFGTDQWNNLYGDTLDDGGFDVHENGDGQFVVSGFRDTSGTHDSWLFTVDSLGAFLSESIHGGIGNELPGSSIEKVDSNYIVAGSSNSPPSGDKDCLYGGYDFWMYNTLSGGPISWQKCLGGTGDDISSRALASPDGSIAICGYTNSTDLDVQGNHGGNDFWVVRLLDGCDVSAAFANSVSGDSVSFTNNSFDAVSFLWTFGDDSTSTEINPTHVYAVAGATYTVCLIATSLCTADTFCTDITIVCPPLNSAFSYSVDSETVSFTDLSDSAISWMWTFGDGDTSTLQNPVHTYASSGTYLVCLIVTNSCSSDTFCQSIIVICPTVSSGFGYAVNGLSVSFSDLSTGATSWEWTFGDGNTSVLPNPTNDYASAGTYQVCLITSNGCNSDTSCQNITVCSPLNAAFSMQQTNNVVTFTDATGTATSWQWTFGDGGTSSLQNPVYTYTANGIYEVCLIASDNCTSDTTCDSVTVIGLGINAANLQTFPFSIYPNPFSDVATVSFNIGTASLVTITLNDVEGRLLGTLIAENLAAGNHSIVISKKNLPAGIYLLQLKEGSLSVVKRLVIE